MTDYRSSRRDRLVAGLAATVGPAASVLHETNILSVGPSATLWPIGFVVVAAGLGLALGVHLWRQSFRALGTLVFLSNGTILSIYGFLLFFFGLGASR